MDLILIKYLYILKELVNMVILKMVKFIFKVNLNMMEFGDLMQNLKFYKKTIMNLLLKLQDLVRKF